METHGYSKNACPVCKEKMKEDNLMYYCENCGTSIYKDEDKRNNNFTNPA